jgi:hypothetical protein
MKSKSNTRDGEIRGELAALRRAARAAKKLARDSNTDFLVMKNGRMVNLNARSRNGRAK